LKPSETIRVAREEFREDLESDVPFEARIARPIHLAL
jgi:hypothetical protein